jgi:hypothetical protein
VKALMGRETVIRPQPPSQVERENTKITTVAVQMLAKAWLLLTTKALEASKSLRITKTR